MTAGEKTAAASDHHAVGILSASRILLIRRLVVTVGSAVATAVIARSLPVEAFGEYSTALATYFLALAFCELGFSQVVARELAQRPSERAALLWTGIRVALLWSVTVTVAYVVFAAATAGGAKLETMLVLVPAMCLAGATVARQLFIVDYQVRSIAAIDTVLTLTQVVVMIGLALLGAGPVSLAATISVTSVLNTVLVAVLARRRVGPRVRVPGMAGQLVRMSLPIGIPSILASAYFSMDLVLAGYLVDAERVALYAAAVKLLTFTAIVPQVLMSVALPGFSALSTDTDRRELSELIARMWHWLLVFGLGACASIAAFAPLAVESFFGPRYDGAAEPLVILMLAGAVSLLSNVLGTLLVALGLAAKMFFQNIVALVATVGLNIWLLPVYGIVGAAWITVGVEVFLVSMSFLWVRRHCTWGPLLAVSLRPTLATVALVVVSLLPLGHGWWHAALAGVVYVVLLTALRGWPFDQSAVAHRVTARASRLLRRPAGDRG